MKLKLNSLKTYRSVLNELKNSEQKLDDILLYVDFVKNRYDLPVILLKDGGVLLLFEISGIDHEKLSVDEREECSNLLKTGFLQLENGYVISNFLDRDINNSHPLKKNGSAPDIIKFIRDKKQQFWDNISSESYSNTIFGSITFRNPSVRKISVSALISEKTVHRFSRNEIEENVEKLYRGMISLKSTLSKFGFFILTRDESFRVLYKLINFETPPPYRDDLSLNIQLAQSGYGLFDETLRISNKYYSKLISVKYPPKYSHAIYLERLFDLNIKFTIKQSFRVINYQNMEKRLQTNQNIARSLSSLDKSSENYVMEADEFMNEVKVNREVPISWNLSIILTSEDERYLNEKTFEVITILKELGCSAIPERYNLIGAFFGSFPGMENFNPRYSTILSSNAGDFFSAHLLFRGDTDPNDYFMDRAKGIFSYTPFTSREEAYHMAITGPTGGGKSFLVNKLLLSGLIDDPRIFVIDLSCSFTELFDFLNEELKEETSILTVSKEKINFSFNPFMIDDLTKDISEQQMKFCEGLLRIMIGPALINDGNRIILTDSLKQFFFQYRSILKNFKRGVPVPPLDILIPIIEQNSPDSNIPNALRYWQTGRRAELFNTGTDTVKAAKYVYFDIRDMESSEDELPAVIYSIFNKIYNDISDPENLNKPKYLFLDEAHRYLKNSEFGFWIDLLIRMGRHYNLLVGIVTQSITDLITDEKWSTGILNNIKQAFFFSGQRGIETAFAKLQMNDSHISLYKNMNSEKREFLYWSSGGIRRVLSPLTDPYTYWIATTDPGERMVRKKMKRKLYEGDTKKTVEELVSISKNFVGEKGERTEFIEEFIKQELETRS